MPFGSPHLCLKRSCVHCKHIILEYVLGHLSGQRGKKPSAKCLSAWQRRDLFLLQVVMHYPQYYFTVIRNPETAAEMEPYCASCFPKHKPKESPFWWFYISKCIPVFAKKPTKQKKNHQKNPTKQKQTNKNATKKTPQTPQSKRGSGWIWKKSPQIENHLINLLRCTQAKQLETEDSPSAVLNISSYFHAFDKHLT